MRWDLFLRLHTIPHVFAEHGSSPRFFSAQVSSDADQRVALARLQSLILAVCTIYGHLHATRQRGCDMNSVGFPFYATTFLEGDGFAQPTELITIKRREE